MFTFITEMAEQVLVSDKNRDNCKIKNVKRKLKLAKHDARVANAEVDHGGEYDKENAAE